MSIKEAYKAGYEQAIVEFSEKLASETNIPTEEAIKATVQKLSNLRDILYPAAGGLGGAGLGGLAGAGLGGAAGGIAGALSGNEDLEKLLALAGGGLGGLAGAGLGGGLGFLEGQDAATESGARSAANRALREALESGEMSASDLNAQVDLTRSRPPQDMNLNIKK